jgi:hypothetical protein
MSKTGIMTSDNDFIYISEADTIYKYDYNGVLLQTNSFDNSTNFHSFGPMVSQNGLVYMLLTYSNGVEKKGVLVFSQNLNIVTVTELSNFSGASFVTIDENKNIYIRNWDRIKKYNTK